MALTPQPSMLSSKLGHTSQTFGTFSSTRNLMPHPVSRELAVNGHSRRGVSAASGAVSFMTATSFHTAAASGTTDATLEDRHLPSFVSITTKEQDYPARLTMATELTRRTSSSTSAERYGDSSLSTSLGDASDASQKEHTRRSENIERSMTAREIKTLLGGLRVSEGAEDDLTRWTKVLTMAAAKDADAGSITQRVTRALVHLSRNKAPWVTEVALCTRVLSLYCTLAGRRAHIPTVRALLLARADPLAIMRGTDAQSVFHAMVTQGAHSVVQLFFEEKYVRDANTACALQMQTPLQLATIAGHAAIVDLLLAKNASANQNGQRSSSALQLALQEDHLPIVLALLRSRANVETEDVNGHGLRPLHLAAFQQNNTIVELLLEWGATVNSEDARGSTPLFHALRAIPAFGTKKNTVHFEHIGDNMSGNDACTSHKVVSGVVSIVKKLVRAKASVSHTNHEGHTPLLVAARNGLFDVCKFLIQSMADVNVCTAADTPLRAAIDGGHTNIVRLLIGEGSTFAYDATDVLHEPARRGDHAMMCSLLKQLPSGQGHTAPCLHASTNGSRAFDLALANGHADTAAVLLVHMGVSHATLEKDVQNVMLLAAGTNCASTITLLLQNIEGADRYVYSCTNGENEGNDNVLIQSIKANSLECVRALIKYSHADLSDFVESTMTRSPLHLAAMLGAGHIVSCLLRGTTLNVNAVDANGATPLMLASAHGCPRTVRTLLFYEAQVNTADNVGKTALYHAVVNGHVAVCLTLAKHHKADANTVDRESNRSMLHAAVLSGQIEIVRVLLDMKACVYNGNATKESSTPLLDASYAGHTGICELLVRHKASVNESDSGGITPLLEASYAGNVDIVQLLLENNANAHARSLENGDTALTTAAHFGHAAVCKLLLQAHADANAVDDMGWTATLAATANGRVDVLRVLRDECSQRIDMNHEDNDGITALRLAAHHSDEKDITQILQTFGQSDQRITHVSRAKTSESLATLMTSLLATPWSGVPMLASTRTPNTESLLLFDFTKFSQSMLTKLSPRSSPCASP